jgi:hypothetical protein
MQGKAQRQEGFLLPQRRAAKQAPIRQTAGRPCQRLAQRAQQRRGARGGEQGERSHARSAQQAVESHLGRGAVRKHPQKPEEMRKVRPRPPPLA